MECKILNIYITENIICLNYKNITLNCMVGLLKFTFKIYIKDVPKKSYQTRIFSADQMIFSFSFSFLRVYVP